MSADSFSTVSRNNYAELSCLSVGEAALARAFAAHRSLGDDIQCGVAPAPAADWFAFSVCCAAGTARILAPPPLLDSVLADPAAAATPLAWRLLLLELAVEPALARLAERDGLLDLTFREDDGKQRAFAFGLSLHGTMARVEADYDVAALLGAHLRDAPAVRTRLPGLTVTLHICVMAATLSRAELTSLAPGDAVRANAWPDNEVHLVAGDMFAWAARREGATLRLIGKRRAVRAELERFAMLDEILPQDSETSLDELPVRLSFEIGTLEVSLAELEALGPGHVFELGRAEGEAVDIRANGRKIGTGRAVVVGGAIAVQIVRITGK